MINNYDNDDDENKLEDDGNISYHNDKQQLKNWKQDKDRDNNSVDDENNYHEIDERDNKDDNDNEFHLGLGFFPSFQSILL